MKRPISYSLRGSKRKIEIKKNSKYKERDSYEDKVLKSFFLNNLNRVSKKI